MYKRIDTPSAIFYYIQNYIKKRWYRYIYNNDTVGNVIHCELDILWWTLSILTAFPENLHTITCAPFSLVWSRIIRDMNKRRFTCEVKFVLRYLAVFSYGVYHMCCRVTWEIYNCRGNTSGMTQKRLLLHSKKAYGIHKHPKYENYI